MSWELLIAGATAALLTLFDLDRTFYIPARFQEKAQLRAWWWGFILVNGLFAAALYSSLSGFEELAAIQPKLRAILIGMGYLAIVRLKLTTFKVEGKEIPFGVEMLYEGAKDFVYKRINGIALRARYKETVDLASQHDLGDLGTRAQLRISQDALLSSDEKKRLKKWLLDVIQDPNTSDWDKKVALADYILSGLLNE